ncbi:hypothetical protein LEMLEM_LOCUS11935, partial [Lemmus lemmus]
SGSGIRVPRHILGSAAQGSLVSRRSAFPSGEGLSECLSHHQEHAFYLHRAENQMKPGSEAANTIRSPQTPGLVSAQRGKHLPSSALSRLAARSRRTVRARKPGAGSGPPKTAKKQARTQKTSRLALEGKW